MPTVMRRAMRLLYLFATLAVVLPMMAAAVPALVTLDRELDGPGTNMDDPCFWVDPADPARTLLFMTSKDSGLLEVYRAATGALVGTIPGFVRANNCAVEGDLLLTTDKLGNLVRVHHIPDFAPVALFAQDMREPMGIDVLTTATGERFVYVTSQTDSTVHVYAFGTWALVRAFPSTLGRNIEPVVADDRYQRVYIARGELEAQRDIGWFNPDGTLVRLFAQGIITGEPEGLALYNCGLGGYLVATSQKAGATEFPVFDRLSLAHLGTFTLTDATGERTDWTDGIDILQTPIPGFPAGMLAACDGCGTTKPDELDIVSWTRIAAALNLMSCPDGRPPACGDGVVDPPLEQCELSNDGACPGRCRSDCTCPPPPICGDGVLNHAAEECDRTDDAWCRGACATDCRCLRRVTLDLPAQADTYIESDKQATWDHGAAPLLAIDASPVDLAYLRFDVSGAAGRITKATLGLTCNDASADGGTVYRVLNPGWVEGDRLGKDATSATGYGLKFVEVDTRVNSKIEATDTSPYVPDFSKPLAVLRSVKAGVRYVADVTPALQAGPGVYSFAITSKSTDRAAYVSRESTMVTSRPLLHVESETPAVCGDRLVNRPSEECDGTDSARCPGACLASCTCPRPPVCGDGLVNRAGELCDGAADATCPGRCRADCTCAPLPVCGDGLVNRLAETCDGDDDDACPGRCAADCTCTPLPACGDGAVNQPDEACDGADDSACPGRCRGDCTCAPLAVCGDGVVNTAAESCDGADDAACPGRCGADCVCATPPVCGDGVVNQLGESCDGADDAACPTRCLGDCSCAPAPACGDGSVNRPSEECDASDDAACPAACRTDCTCPRPPACGDGAVNRDGEACDGADDAACPGRCLADCTCTPCGNGSVDDTAEQCDGSDDGACPGRCRTDCTCAPAPVCGDGVVNQGGEVCDRTADAACPGRCRADCTCAPLPVCGDGVVNRSGEQCDGAADAACPGRCRGDCTCAPLPVCGDGVVNQSGEQCDGAAAAACLGRCRADCTCAPLPVCGDGVVNQSGEQCDGAADAACPGRCRADCTCAPAPVCGDGAVNQATELCDGAADGACPGRCQADCRCRPVTLNGVVEADVTVSSAAPATNFGTATALEVDASEAKIIFFRVRVTGVERTVSNARLRLRVGSTTNAKSVSGGRIHRASCTWAETTTTWNTRAAFDAAVLSSLGAIAMNQVVEFDVTPAITADGVYCFAIDSLSTDGADYVSREAASGRPEFFFTTAP